MGSHSRLKIIMPDEIVAKPLPEVRALPARELRPIAQVRKIPLIEREIREHLSRAALDAIFGCVEVISEGEVAKGGSRPQFLGSTMLTINVADLFDILREPADEGTARRLAALLARDDSLVARVEAVVRREVERILSIAPHSVRGETQIRAQGTRVYLDIDVEATLP
jgi:hypothetical protein